MLEKQLKQLGFAKNEIKTYLALFELGRSRAGQIIEHTGLHRNLVYSALDSLVSKNIISTMEQGKVAVFEINDPVVLQEHVEEKMDIAKNVVEELQNRLHSKPRDVRVYDGIEGIKRTREKVVEKITSGDTYYILGISNDQANEELDPFFAINNTKIVKKGAHIKALYNQSSPLSLLANRKLEPGTQARKLPFGAKNPMWITFFQDYLNLSVVGTEPVTFSIRSQEAVSGFVDYFEYFWNQKASTETGNEALYKALYGMMDELNPGDEYYVLGGTYGAYAENTRNFYLKYHEKRITKGVVANILGEANMIREYNKHFKHSDPSLTRLKEFISPLPQPFQINLFKGKTKMIIYSKEPTVISFEDREVYDGFKTYFDNLWNQETRIVRGAEALRDLWLEGLDTGEIRWIGARGYFVDSFPEYFAQIRNKAEKMKNLKCKLIIDPGFRGHILTRLPWIETRYNLSSIRNPNAIWLFGSKVLIINWAKKEPVIFLSTNSTLVQSYNDYFDELWNQETHIARGPEVVKNIWLEATQLGELKFIGARGYFVDRYPDMFEEIKNIARQKKGLKWKNIVDPSARNHPVNKLPWMEARYTLKGSKNPNVVWLWGNKVAIANWTEDEPVVFISENKHLVQSYNDYFEELWNLKQKR